MSQLRRGAGVSCWMHSAIGEGELFDVWKNNHHLLSRYCVHMYNVLTFVRTQSYLQI